MNDRPADLIHRALLELGALEQVLLAAGHATMECRMCLAGAKRNLGFALTALAPLAEPSVTGPKDPG
jgi:hypothetical protein